jgi:FkbM family methyltransferase
MVSRAFQVLFIERRLPIRAYKWWYKALAGFGKEFVTIRVNGLSIRGFTKSMFMFQEVWNKGDYRIPGFPLKEGMAVVDIGANQGFFSLWAANQGARVWAIEPCAQTFEILVDNVRRNRLENRIATIQAAVSDHEGEVPLFIDQDASGQIHSESVSLHGHGRFPAASVKSLTLDSLLRNLPQIDLLKLDCEGAEYEILGSASPEIFQKIDRIVMECHERRMPEAEAILKRAGYSVQCQDFGWLGLLKAVRTTS